MAYIDILMNKREQVLKNFREIKEKNISIKIDLLKSLLEDNNTEEEIILEYLKLKKVNKDADFIEKLKTYKVAIHKNNYNQFQNKEKKSAYEKLINIFNELKEIESETETDTKLVKIIKILEKKIGNISRHFQFYIQLIKNYILIL